MGGIEQIQSLGRLISRGQAILGLCLNGLREIPELQRQLAEEQERYAGLADLYVDVLRQSGAPPAMVLMVKGDRDTTLAAAKNSRDRLAGSPGMERELAGFLNDLTASVSRIESTMREQSLSSR
jgi:hypothetical protein